MNLHCLTLLVPPASKSDDTAQFRHGRLKIELLINAEKEKSDGDRTPDVAVGLPVPISPKDDPRSFPAAYTGKQVQNDGNPSADRRVADTGFPIEIPRHSRSSRCPAAKHSHLIFRRRKHNRQKLHSERRARAKADAELVGKVTQYWVRQLLRRACATTSRRHGAGRLARLPLGKQPRMTAAIHGITAARFTATDHRKIFFPSS
jgi:hypothetical protein